METDDAREFRSAAGQFDDGGAAETITYGGDAPGIGEFMFLQDGETGPGACAEQLAVFLVFARFGRGFIVFFGSNALAVDIEGEGIISKFGEHLRAFLFVIGKALPLVTDE